MKSNIDGITGRQLFELHVNCGLATADKYKWDQLSNSMQNRWNAMALILQRNWKEYLIKD